MRQARLPLSKSLRGRLLACGWMAALSCSTAFAAAAWSLPDDARIRGELERFVNVQRQVPGAVVGVASWDAAGTVSVRFSSAGESGRSGLPLDEHTRFELGSITKAFNGLVLAELIEAGALSEDSRLADLVPTPPSPWPDGLAAVTVVELANHQAGLPRLPVEPAWIGRAVFSEDPYAGASVEDLFREAARAGGRATERPSYSNLGAALLGQALARHTGLSYPELLSKHLLVPAGVSGMAVQLPHAPRPERLARGHDLQLRPAAHWRFDGYAPAGAVVGSASEVLQLITHQIHRNPRAWERATRFRELPGSKTRGAGLGWVVQKRESGRLIWHNGGTGGFRTFLGVLPDQGGALVVLANGTGDVDTLALHLLDAGRPAPEPPTVTWLARGFVLLGVLGAPLLLFWESRRGAGAKRPADRLDAMLSLAGALFVLALSERLGAWREWPFALWWIGLAATLATAVFLLTRPRPWMSGTRLSRTLRLLLAPLWLLCAWTAA